MTLHGPAYPSSTTLEPTPQEFVLNLLCATEQGQPEFKSYDGARALVEWSAPAGCNFRSETPSGGDGKTPDKEAEAVGSGIGWFFLLFVFPSAFMDDKLLTWNTLRLFIAFAGYFALGAYYNYTTYGATGVDLIPCVSSLLFVALILKRLSFCCRHRDFWREVPYMLRDVVSHLCSSFQSRHSTSRGGYIPV
jgi:hypothetical protein